MANTLLLINISVEIIKKPLPWSVLSLPTTLRLMQQLPRQMPWTRMNIRTSLMWKPLWMPLYVTRRLLSRAKWIRWRRLSKMRLQLYNIRMRTTLRLMQQLPRQMPWTRIISRISLPWKPLWMLLSVARTLPSNPKWIRWQRLSKMRLKLSTRMLITLRLTKPLLRQMHWTRMSIRISLVWKPLSRLLSVTRILLNRAK